MVAIGREGRKSANPWIFCICGILIWSRRAGLNRQPADYEKPFNDNIFNVFKLLHVQQEEECGTMVTPFAPYLHPEEIPGNSSSNPLRGAPSERIRTASEIPIEVDLTDGDAFPIYMKISDKIQHLRRVGMPLRRDCRTPPDQPLGARSSYWRMPQRASSPRA